MTTAFENALAVINTTLKNADGHSVTYRRDEATVSLTAVPTAPLQQVVNDAEAVLEEVQYRDWLIDPDDLVIDSTEVEPAFGDEIDWEDPNGNTVTFEVVAPVGDQVWRWTDENQTLLRVHSLKTAEG